MVFASNNQNKLREVKKILIDYNIQSLKDKNINIDVIEDQNSFYGNALKKAKEIYELVNEEVIADDSGLCIEYFDGWPGVYTARFLGEDVTVEQRNDYIIEKMKDIPLDKRNASFVCVIVYYDGINTIVGEGILRGKISLTNMKTNKFGFDDILELDDGRVIASLNEEEKNVISARYLALIDLVGKMKNKVK